MNFKIPNDVKLKMKICNSDYFEKIFDESSSDIEVAKKIINNLSYEMYGDLIENVKQLRKKFIQKQNTKNAFKSLIKNVFEIVIYYDLERAEAFKIYEALKKEPQNKRFYKLIKEIDFIYFMK